MQHPNCCKLYQSLVCPILAMVTTIGSKRNRYYIVRQCCCKVLELHWSTRQSKLPKQGAICKRKNETKRKENKYFPTELTLNNWKHLSLNCFTWSIILLDKQSYRLTEQAAVVWSSQKTNNSNRAARIWPRKPRQKCKKVICRLVNKFQAKILV